MSISEDKANRDAKPSRGRSSIPKPVQVRVFRRDRWLCRWCGRPVVFPPAMRFLERYLRQHGHVAPLAYFSERWRRDLSPLLDHLAAVIDHKDAFSMGGAHDEGNLVTACNKCNVRKGADTVDAFANRVPQHQVKPKYGEPLHWDGLTAVFVTLAHNDPAGVTPVDRAWYQALVDPSSEQGGG